MDALEAILGRRAVRSYQPGPLDKEQVEALIDAAIHAPSGLNRQPWSFAVIQGEHRISDLEARVVAAWRGEILGVLDQVPAEVAARVRELIDAGFSIFHGAATVMLVLTPPDDGVALLDAAFAAENLMVAAHAMGLGSCPIGLAQPYFQLPAVLTELGLDARLRVVATIVVGKPAGPPPPMPPRKPPVVTWC